MSAATAGDRVDPDTAATVRLRLIGMTNMINTQHLNGFNASVVAFVRGRNISISRGELTGLNTNRLRCDGRNLT